MPRVAVIILNWNGQRLLDQFLPAVVANTAPDLADIIVADNGSTDDSLKLLSDKFPTVGVLTLGSNYGFAGGYNRAIRRTEYEFTVLLNSDAAPAPGWLAPMLQAMDADPKLAACQPKLLSYRNPDTFEYAGASGGFIDRHGYTYCRGRIFDTCEVDSGQYDRPRSVFWATGAALMVRTRVYLDCGGLDEDFFAHMEEVDLCWRILLAGYDVRVIPQSVVYHLGGASLSAANPRKTYLNFRNNLLMLHKNLPDSTRTRKLLVRRLLDTIAWAKYVVTLDWRNAAAIIRAHRDFARMRRRYTTHPQVDLLDSRSDTRRDIIVDYYLRRRRTYSDLFPDDTGGC